MREEKTPNIKFRFNIITTIIYIIGIILLVQLFNLQIVHGEEYREKSNTRLTRETTLNAARGSILDRTGNEIAGTKMQFKLDIYKTKLTSEELNNTILKIINVLEKNGDTYTDTFPIKVEPFEYTFSSEESLAKWKKSNKLDENITAEEAFYEFKEKYGVINEDVKEARKIIGLRYRMSSEGYSSTKSIEISDNISKNSAMEFNEKNDEFSGIDIVVKATRKYPYGNFASHILGYIGKISDEEYTQNKENGYLVDDDYGKTGIEYVFEKYLKGKNGVRQIDMAVDGSVTEEYIVEEATKGSDVVLTIDANLQNVAEDMLEKSVNELKAGVTGTVYDSNFGAAVVMDVKTGEVLAMASYPDYDPNLFVGGISYSDYENISNIGALYSKATQGSYAPGSTFKMVTALAALRRRSGYKR